MANTINYASKYAPELDKMITQEAKTGFMADNAFKAKFVGAKTVYLPEITLEGLGDYSRETGYAKGDVGLSFKDYTLTKERSKQMILDAQDADESGVADLAGKLVGEYTRTKVVPEIDAYALSKLHGYAADTKNGKAAHTKVYSASTAVKDLLDGINYVESANGYSNEAIVAMVDPVLYSAIMTSTELQRMIIASDFKQGEVNLKVKSLNGVAIIPVSAERMHTVIKTTDTGFEPDTTSKTLHAVIMPKGAASLIKKVDKVNMFNPDEVEDMDAYKINFRLYYDLFVKKSKVNTIYSITG
jgi:hypothetical protein